MAEGKVVSLWGNEIPEGGVYPSAVKVLEEWLARAMRGEFMAVAMVGVRPDMNVCNVMVSHSGPVDLLLIGGMARATHRPLEHSEPRDMDDAGDGDAPA